MQWVHRATARLGCAAIVAVALAGCTLPRSGPTAGEIRAAGSSEQYDMHILTVTPEIAAATRLETPLGFSSAFLNASTISPDTISPGDRVSVTVWENVDNGLLAGVGQKNTVLQDLQVDQAGNIYVPYAGEVHAAGLTPDTLRAKIADSLRSQTPDPQVEVHHSAGDGTTVSVLGGVEKPGVYPIDAPTRRLSAMLALAGGTGLVPDTAQVRVERGGKTGRVWLQDLYDEPRNDIALRPNDRIIVEEDRRAFTVLGASTVQARVNFKQHDMSAIEGLAAAGGLNGRAADPTGIFIFREETAAVANTVLGRHDLVGPQRMAYLLDTTRPEGLFSAREFYIRDGDTLYITEAPFAAWSRVLAVAVTAVNFTASVESLTGN